MKQFSEACERNREPILGVLREVLAGARRVLEIGSGTGQHAVYFAAALPQLEWLPSDLPENHPGIEAWRAEAGLPNLQPPRLLDVHAPAWPVDGADAVFSANTAHILDWAGVERMIAGAAALLPAGGPLVLYGPFNYGGRYTSEGNARLDAWLRARDPASGVRDFEAVDALARGAGLALERDVAMPSNNRTLVWRRPPAGGG